MKNKSALFNLNKGYRSPLEGNAFGAKLKENMDNGMSKSEAATAAASALSNLNKGYGQQVKSPLETDGIIIKALRSIGTKEAADKVKQRRQASGNFTMAELVAKKASKSNTTNLGPIGTAKNEFGPMTEKQANYAANQAKPPTQIKSIGTSGVQNDGSGNEGFGIGSSTKTPKVKTKPIVKARKTVNAVKTTSAYAQKIKTTGPKVKSAEAKADLKIMPIVKDATSSRKSRRLKKTIGKAVEARNKGEKAIKNIKSSSSASDIAKNQAKALKQRRKYDRMKKRAGRIGKRM